MGESMSGSFTKKLWLTTTIVASMGLFAADFAMAQEASAPAKEAKKESKKDEASKVSEIVVTGSRIRRNDYNSPSPITVITAERAELLGTPTGADLLQGLTQSAVSQQTNGLLGGYVVEGGPGVQTLSLRGLGAQRTLVLINGRRLGPAGVGGTVGPVDLSVLPDMMFSRADILKDGSSSIYGSDAIAGVVNYITKKDTDGLQVRAFANVPERSGGSVTNFSAIWGKTFERGYISAAASILTNEGLTQGDRKELGCNADYYFDLQSGQRVDVRNYDNSGPKCLNLSNNAIQSRTFYGGQFQYDPKLTGYSKYPAASLGLRGFLPDWVRAGRYGQPATFPFANYDTPLLAKSTVMTPRRQNSIVLTGGYDISSKVSAYAELLLNERRTSNFGVYQFFPTVSQNNPTNTLAAGLIAASGGGADGQIVPIIARANGTNQDVKYIRGVFGLTGTVDGLGFLNGFKWDTYYQFSGSDGKYGNTFVYKDRVIAAAGVDDSGKDVSNGLACNPALLKTTSKCVTIAWADPRILSGNFTPEERAYLFGTETGKTTYYQHAFEFSLTGDLFQLPAGKVGSAAGIYLRRDEINDTPGENARNRNYWGFTTSGITKGNETVKEAYAELSIPLFKNLAVAKSIDLNVSGRYSDYDSYGDNSTYKVGLDWAITSEYRIRGSYGTSFRAPSLYEHYLADQTAYSTLRDPCTKWGESTNQNVRARCAAEGIPDTYPGYSATPMVISGGGSKLKAETSTSYSFGVVWQPSFVNLKMSLDYFDFNVKNEVAKFGASSIVNSCYTANLGYQEFCTLFKRDPSSKDIKTINDSYLNIAEQNTRGIDLGINFGHDFRFGKLNVDSQSTWQWKNSSSLNGSVVTDSTGSIGSPRFVNTTTSTLMFGDYTAAWSLQVIGQQSDRKYVLNGGVVTTDLTYPAGYYKKVWAETTIYHTISLSKRMDKLTVRAGINNLFDEKAPSVSSGEFRIGTAALNNYDLLGRRFFVSIDKRF